jgi:hypothetical protein
MASAISYCTPDLTPLNSDDRNYDFHWSSFNASYTPTQDIEDAYNAFQYTNASQISSYPLTGPYTTYLGGGYVYKMNGDAEDTVSNFTFLQQANWIDMRTRAVFVEFAVYNPNVNMFVHCYLLFEFMPTGSIVKSFRFSPMTLFDSRNSLFSFGTICAIIYLIMIFALTIRQIYVISVQKMKYFTQIWSYFDLSLIAFSFTSFAIWLYRLWEAQRLMTQAGSSNQNGKFINLQLLAYWDDILSCMLAFCTCIGSLKFMKILSFNKIIRVLFRALRNSVLELAAFGVLFSVIVFAFIQAGFGIFNDHVYGLSTFAKSVESGGLLILGKFDLTAMMNASPALAIIYYLSFHLFVILVMLNMLVSLLIDGFGQAKKDDMDEADPMNLEEYMYGKLGDFFVSIGFKSSRSKYVAKHERIMMKQSLSQTNNYMSHIDTFNFKTSVLVAKIDEV